MSERYATWIKIGGRIKRSRVEGLLKAIREAGVRTDWGEPFFAPKTIKELLEACKDGWLQLCDEEARYGEFPQLETACQRLKLGYRRHCEGICGYDAEVVDWRPGVKAPVARKSSNEHPDDTLVLASAVTEAIALLEGGHIQQGIDALKHLCPDVPDLPPFKII
jgi:hypothetical protein